MQAARLFKHRQLNKCHKSTERSLRRRDMDMAEMCGAMEYKLDGEDWEESGEFTKLNISGTNPRPTG